MSLAQETEMSEAEIDAFLSERETGVLSLAKDNDPYAIPVSYGYDPETGTLFMRLVSTPESEKRVFLSSSPAARVVVYDENDDRTRYRSVVAKGTLAEIDPDALTAEKIVQYGQTRRPLFEIWGQEKEDLDIQLYELDPVDLQGRRTEIDRS